MVDYSGIADGERKLQKALYHFILGINGQRKNPVTRKQIMGWFHGTPESMVVAALEFLLNDEVIMAEKGKFRVMTFRDHANKRRDALSHWTDQAYVALTNGQTMTDFVAAALPEHRLIARLGFIEAQKIQKDVKREIAAEFASVRRFGRPD